MFDNDTNRTYIKILSKNVNLYNYTMPYKLTSDIPDNLIESYLSESEIAVDTELHGLRLFRDEVCLVQLCDDKNNVSLIKPEKNQTPPNLKPDHHPTTAIAAPAAIDSFSFFPICSILKASTVISCVADAKAIIRPIPIIKTK